MQKSHHIVELTINYAQSGLTCLSKFGKTINVPDIMNMWPFEYIPMHFSFINLSAACNSLMYTQVTHMEEQVCGFIDNRRNFTYKLLKMKLQSHILNRSVLHNRYLEYT